MNESTSASLAEVVRGAIRSALDSVHTAIPAAVVRYDAAKQQADLQPLIKASYEDEEGNRVVVNLPVVRCCPVQFSGGGGLVVVHPVSVGDTGLLIFAEASIDKWLGTSGAEVDPDFDTRHNLTDGIFIPGVRPFGNPRDVPTGVIAIGRDGGSFQPAVLGDGLKWWLYNHVHPPVTGGPPTAPFLEALDNNISGNGEKIFSETVKLGDDPL